MTRARVTANSGLRLRDSPRDGETLRVLPRGSDVEILGRETWLRVRIGDSVGFVLADYVEPTPAASPPADSGGDGGPPRDMARIEVYTRGRHFAGEPIRADLDFFDALDRIDEAAGESQLQVWVTSSFREPYQEVSGKVVEPAKFSNHYVGHAIDMNLLLGGEWFDSRRLGQPFNGLPPAIQGFIGRLEANGLRWGGRFGDPVHIDDGLNVEETEKYEMKLASLW